LKCGCAKAHGSSFEKQQSSIYASLAPDDEDTMCGLARYGFVRPYKLYDSHFPPIGEEINDHYHWHMEIIPKLNQSGGILSGELILY